MAKKITETVVAEVKAQVAEQYKSATPEELKAAIKELAAERKDLKAQNAESIKLYRERAEKGRRNGIAIRELQGMLKEEKEEVTAEETMGFIAEADESELEMLMNAIKNRMK